MAVSFCGQESDEGLPFLAESFSRWTIDTYCQAMDYEPPSDADTEAAPTHDEGLAAAEQHPAGT